MDYQKYFSIFDPKMVLLLWMIRIGVIIGFYFVLLESGNNPASLIGPTIIGIAILAVSSWNRELILTSKGIIARRKYFSVFNVDEFISFEDIKSIEHNLEEKKKVSYYRIFASHAHSMLLKKNRIILRMKKGPRKDYYFQVPARRIEEFIYQANRLYK